jgi:hypothetical protein
VRIDADDELVGIGGGGRHDERTVTGAQVDGDIPSAIDEGSESADVGFQEPFSVQDAHLAMMADSCNTAPGDHR